METNITALGRKTPKLGKQSKNGLMEMSMRVSFSEVACMGKGSLLGKTKATMRAPGFRILWREKDYSFGLIKKATEGSGRTILCIFVAFIHGLMAVTTKACIISTRSTAGESTRGQMAKSSRDNG